MPSEKSLARLFIGNSGLNSEKLRTIFEPYGEIDSVHCLSDFAFVQFASSSDAKTALNAVKGKPYKKFGIDSMRVELSHDNSGGKKGNPGKPCFNCGKEGHFARYTVWTFSVLTLLLL